MNEQRSRRADWQGATADKAPPVNGQVGMPRDTRSASRGLRQMVLWQKAQGLAELVSQICDSLPAKRGTEAIALQLLRAAGSIPANIAEGYGRYSQPAYRNHLSIARGSAFEVESWVDLLLRRGDVTPEMGNRAIAFAVEVQKLLTIRMKSLSNQSYAIRDEQEAAYQT